MSVSRIVECINDLAVYLEIEGIYANMVILMDDEAIERLSYKLTGEYKMIHEISPSEPLSITTAIGPVKIMSKKALQR